MKRIVGFIAILLISCTLFSCEAFFCPQVNTISGKNYDTAIEYEGVNFTVSSRSNLNYTFYKIPQEELVGRFFAILFLDVYKTENPDFGTAFRLTTAGLDYNTLLTYCFHESTTIPDIQEVKLDKMMLTDDIGVGESYFEYMSSYSHLVSLLDMIIMDNDEWCKSDGTSTLEDVLDFGNSIPSERIARLKGGYSIDKGKDRHYDYFSRGYLVFTLKDYDSFFCGPLKIIEYNDRLYVQIYSNTDDSSEYVAVREEYQELFISALEKQSNN